MNLWEIPYQPIVSQWGIFSQVVYAPLKILDKRKFLPPGKVPFMKMFTYEHLPLFKNMNQKYIPASFWSKSV